MNTVRHAKSIEAPSRRSPRAVAAMHGGGHTPTKVAEAGRRLLLQRLRREYTPSVCERTLQVNEHLPIHEVM